MRKIVVDRRIPGLAAALKALDREAVIDEKEGSDICRDDVRDADALFIRTRTRCSSSLLEGSSVKLIGSATIGTDHIDLLWCEAHGIQVVNAPGCNAQAVMQYVAASLDAAGYDPAGQVLGVIGKGNIGSLVVNLYRQSGARVLVSDPPRQKDGMADENYLSFEEVLARSHAITFHVPYLTAGQTEFPTSRMLTPSLLRANPQLGIVVNASRGLVLDPSVLDEDRRFIIDTWPFEDEPNEWPEDARKKIIDKAFIATPHIAGYSLEGKQRATQAMTAAYADFLRTGKVATETSPAYFGKFSLDNVVNSFDPLQISTAFKSDPSTFENLRGKHLRPEPQG